MTSEEAHPDATPPILEDPGHVFQWSASLAAAVIFIASMTLLLVAASLKPSTDGVGTHSQLGMAPCGFLDRAGIPCATCGMTTSFALAADGRLIDAIINQPAGALLALLAAVIALVSGYAMITGLNLLPVIRATWRPATVIGLGVIVMAAWGYKIIVMQQP